MPGPRSSTTTRGASGGDDRTALGPGRERGRQLSKATRSAGSSRRPATCRAPMPRLARTWRTGRADRRVLPSREQPGGRSRLAHAPAPTSAICLRPQGGSCDSGAYEVGSGARHDRRRDPADVLVLLDRAGRRVPVPCRSAELGPGTFVACTSPLNSRACGRGSYTFVVRAVDSGGVGGSVAGSGELRGPPQATAGKFVVVNEVRGRVRVKRAGWEVREPEHADRDPRRLAR